MVPLQCSQLAAKYTPVSMSCSLSSMIMVGHQFMVKLIKYCQSLHKNLGLKFVLFVSKAIMDLTDYVPYTFEVGNSLNTAFGV